MEPWGPFGFRVPAGQWTCWCSPLRCGMRSQNVNLCGGAAEVLDDYCDRVGTESGRNFVECSVRGQFTGELNLHLGDQSTPCVSFF